MAHNIVKLAGKILNTPQLITQQAFDPIAQYLITRISAKDFAIYSPQDNEEDPQDCPIVEMVGDVAVIKIEGSLTYKPQYTLCGEVGTSYEKLIEATQFAIDANAKMALFEVDSGGGEAAHAFDSADTVREMLNTANIPSVAYVDGIAASAAYLWSVIADEVVAHPEASVGSIGCVVCLTDVSKALEQDGIKPIYITSTDGKVPFNTDGSFSDTFLEKLKQDVMRLGDNFVSHVSKYTGLSVEEIKATDAQMFHAEKALEMGLVSSVMNHREFSNYLYNKLKEI